jgi:hypothetical protein
LIAERQQYEQWMSTLDAKREGTAEHVFERVQNDYRKRLERVVSDIKSHAEELQLSISTLSSRLVEVAREEDTRREGLQEAELRAAVGEYDPQQWDQLKSEAEEAIGKIAADRASLDSQLGELRAIQKLSELGSVGVAPSSASASVSPSPAAEAEAELPPAVQKAAASADKPAEVQSKPAEQVVPQPVQKERVPEPAAAVPQPAHEKFAPPKATPGSQERLPLENVAAAASSAANAASRPRSSMRTPPAGVSAAKPKPEPKVDNSKTLKCPECGTPNYPTEWYCERCGGELATM